MPSGDCETSGVPEVSGGSAAGGSVSVEGSVASGDSWASKDSVASGDAGTSGVSVVSVVPPITSWTGGSSSLAMADTGIKSPSSITTLNRQLTAFRIPFFMTHNPFQRKIPLGTIFPLYLSSYS